MFRYFTCNRDANRLEFEYWQKHQNDTHVIPCLQLLFGGFVLIQPRSDPLPVTDNQLQTFCPWAKGVPDADSTKQFALHNGIPVLVDYGRDDTHESLLTLLEESLQLATH